MPREMSQAEQKHAWLLQARLRAGGQLAEGAIRAWSYEAIKLYIGPTPKGKDMWYTPDFLVQLADGSIELHEIKGEHVWEDSYVKFCAAARQYPMFRFVMYQLKNHQWERSEVRG